MLVGVAHLKSDRTPRGFSLKHPTEDLHPVGFLPACGDGTLSWSATVKLMLYEVEIDVDAGRHTVNHTSHRLAMTLSK